MKIFDKALVSAKHAMANKAGEAYVDSGVKILIAVVVGAILMAGVVALFNGIILPEAGNRITELFKSAGKGEGQTSWTPST